MVVRPEQMVQSANRSIILFLYKGRNQCLDVHLWEIDRTENGVFSLRGSFRVANDLEPKINNNIRIMYRWVDGG